MILSILVRVAAAEPVDDTAAWAAARAAELVAVAPSERLERVRSWVTAEPSEDRRASLVALGRLDAMLAEQDGPSPHLETYTRAMLVAVSGGRRSYIAAAAGLGGAVDETGDPTMPEAAAVALYAERRATVGGAWWTLCWTTPSLTTKGFGTMGVEGDWRATPLTAEAPPVASRCVSRMGWTVYLGDRPVHRAADLPEPLTSTCGRKEFVLDRGGAVLVTPGRTVGSSRVIATADARPDECLGLAWAREGAAVYNATILADLKLVGDPMPDARPPGVTTLKQCDRPKPDLVDVCDAISGRGTPRGGG